MNGSNSNEPTGTPIPTRQGWHSRTHTWRSPGGRYRMILHTETPPADAGRIPMSYLRVWDDADPKMPALLPMATTMGPGPDIVALVRGYAYLFALENPGHPESQAAVDSAARDGIHAKMNRLKLGAFPLGATGGTWEAS